MQRPDTFGMMEAQVRPIEETDQAEEKAGGHRSTAAGTRSAVHFRGDPAATPAAFDRANQVLYAIPCLVTDKAVTLLAGIHAYGDCMPAAMGRKSRQRARTQATAMGAGRGPR